ncbi:MAG TPA: hypothetical protein VF648_21740 [Pyrinomonadaceae bacterium]|jgi:hypothetical protein
MKIFFLLIIFIFLSACYVSQSSPAPSIEITKIPPQDEGGPDKMVDIEGTVSGSKPGQQIVLFAKSGTWWLQPFVKRPYTEIQTDSRWQNSIHGGTDYAALLVEPNYRPPSRTDTLPEVGDGVVAVAIVKGTGEAPAPSDRINFSGYQWLARRQTIPRKGLITVFDPANAWTDERGFLHLRITNNDGQWTSGKIDLMPTLGYGTYIFTVRDISRLEPAGVLTMSTWDVLESGQNHREMMLEVSRPGAEPNKNLNYIIQPYYQPTNMAQFNVPLLGVLTHSFHWRQGKVEFKTVRGGDSSGSAAKTLAEHTFTLGIPSSEGEKICIALFITDYSPQALQEMEVVIEKFEYLP